MRNERSDRSVVKHGEADVDGDVQHANKIFCNVSRSTLARNAPNMPKWAKLKHFAANGQLEEWIR